MVKTNPSLRSFLLASCSLFTLSIVACAPQGAHKPDGPSLANAKSAGASYESVRGIFAQRCSGCHNSGRGLPDWLVKSVAEGKRATIALRIGNKSMPQVGSAEADKITPAERSALIAWANGGGPTAPSNEPNLKTLLITDNPKALKLFAAKCSACHGAEGVSQGPDIPNLASHDKVYLLARIQGFLTPDSTKSPMVENLHMILDEFNLGDGHSKLADEVFDYVATHFNEKPLNLNPELLLKERSAFDPATQALYEKGKTLFADNACASCHLAEAQRPIEGAPMIMGQKFAYLKKRIPEEAASTRADNPMPGVLDSLSDQDRLALEIYVSHTAPAEVVQ